MRSLWFFPVLALLATRAPAQKSLLVEKETALGGALAAEHRRNVPRIDDPQIREYLTSFGDRLNGTVRSPVSISIEVVQPAASRTDAVGLPGGYVFLPLALLADASSELDVARQIAHALAHIDIFRRSFDGRAAAAMPGSAPIPIFFGSWLGAHDPDLLVPMAFRKKQMEQEAEARRMTEEWISRSGFTAQTSETSEFIAMREHARRLQSGLQASRTPTTMTPSLRSRRP